MLRSAALLGLLALGACSFAGADVETRYVDAVTAPCTGEGVHACLRVRPAPEAEWELFYGAIEGFTHEPGFAYVLEVEVRAVEDPPADGSSLAYRLVRVVSKVPV